jgi:hypothetical protein
MKPEKLFIFNFDTGDVIDVLFNPTEYTVEESNSWEEQARERQKPELQFTSQSLKKVSMELFFDTYEQKIDVRTHTNKIARLLVVSEDDGDGARPPIVELNWGPADPDTTNGIFPFVCVLDSVSQKFTLFSDAGMPVRATLSVAFTEYTLPIEEAKRKPRRGSFPARTHTVTAGETLDRIAAALWKAPHLWRRIAEANDIDNPRLLQSGQVLVVPAIE